MISKTIPDNVIIESSQKIKDSAEKDLEIVCRLHDAVKAIEDVGILVVNEERGDFFQFFEDCKEQLKRLVENPLQELKGEDFDEVSNYYAFYSEVYFNSDFDFIELWPKVMPNTMKTLESLGIKLGWCIPTCSGDFV